MGAALSLDLPLRAAPRGRKARPGAGPHSLSSDGRPAARQGMQTPHRSAALSVDASSLAVSCGSRGVSLDIGTASLIGTRDSARCALSAATTGIAPRPREASRRDLVPAKRRIDSPAARRNPRSTAVSRSRWHRPHPRATADVASRAVRCVDRLCCSGCSEALGRHLNSGDAITPGLVPSHVAKGRQGDARHHSGASPRHHRLFSYRIAGRHWPECRIAPRHYRTPPPWGAGGGSDGARDVLRAVAAVAVGAHRTSAA